MQYRKPQQARKFHDAWIRQELPEIATDRIRRRFIGRAEIDQKDAERLREPVLVLRR